MNINRRGGTACTAGGRRYGIVLSGRQRTDTTTPFVRRPRHGSTPGYPVLHVFFGFLLGMLSMYIATRFYGPPQNSSHA
jgi:hypothetical protein